MEDFKTKFPTISTTSIQVFTSLNLALVPDCGDSSIEVYGRCLEKHTYLRRKTSDEEKPRENEGTHLRELVKH